MKANRFQTLNDALASEGLLETWDPINYPPIPYDSTFSYTWNEPGTRFGRFVSITRFEDGMYERPVHYSRG